MSKIKVLIVMFIIGSFITLYPGKVHAQDPLSAVIKEAITKVVKAVDLRIQRLQTKTIWLQNAQKVIENTMSKLKLDEISNWVKKQKELYADYFEELSKIKSVISYYHRIKRVTETQLAVVQEYKRAFDLFKRDKSFTPEELEYMAEVYAGIINESIKNLDQVSLIVKSFTTKMTDAKRLELINRAADKIDNVYMDLQAFNSQNVLLSIQRAKDGHDIEIVKKLHGIN